MDGFPASRFVQQKIDRCLRRLDFHELRLAFRRGDLVFAELIAIGAGKIALVGQVDHQCLKREIRRRLLHGFRFDQAGHDGAGVKHLLDQFGRIRFAHATGNQIPQQLFMLRVAFGEAVNQSGGVAVQFEDRAGGNQIQKAALGCLKVVKLAEPIDTLGFLCFRCDHCSTSGWSHLI